MDISECITWLKILRANMKTFPEVSANKKIEALSMAIKLIEQEPTTKNDLAVSSVPEKNSKKLEKDCESDCIIRDSAIKALDYDIEHFEFKPGVSQHMDDIAKLLNTIYEIQANNIKALPSVTPRPKTGYWIEHPHEAGQNWEYSRYECSECHVWSNDDSDYCPNCGAKMVDPQESEDS